MAATISERKRLILTAIAVALVGMVTGLLLGGALLPSQAADQQYNERTTTTTTVTKVVHTHDGLPQHTHTITTVTTTTETTPHGWFHNLASTIASGTTKTASSGTQAAAGEGRQMTYEILQVNERFVPDTITVPVGATVTWTSWDSDQIIHEQHTVVDDSGLFDSGSIPYMGSFSYTYTEPGVYPFHCRPHETMHGKVIVVE